MITLDKKFKFCFILFCSFNFIWPIQAYSQACQEAANPFYNSNTERNYKIKIDADFLSATGLTSNQINQATVLGADAWNWQGNSGHFRYTGTTNVSFNSTSDINTQAECTSKGITYSIVYFKNSNDGTSGAAARTSPICSGNHFVVYMYLNDNSEPPVQYPWGNDAIDNTLKDVAGTISHEFGHALNLGHCDDDDSSYYCTMHPGSNANHRGLYQWDLICSINNSGFRSAWAYSRIHDNTGFGSSNKFSSEQNITKATSGITYDPYATWTSAYHRSSSIAWDKNANGSYTTLTNPSAYNGVGFVSTVWRESTATDRVIYSYYQDSTPYSEISVHKIR